MFDELVVAAGSASGAAAGVGAWARVENAACARRLAASADLLDAAFAADGSADKDQWCIDNWDAVAAEVAAAQSVSLGVASHQLLVAKALRDRLPRVAAVFATGVISYRLVAEVVNRTKLVCDTQALAAIDTELVAQLAGWTTLSVVKIQESIDYWVDRYDPAAVRRSQNSARGRHVDVHLDQNGSGFGSVEAVLFAHDAAAVDARLDALAATVCAADPRTIDQRRADAMAALLHGGDPLGCGCGADACEAAGQTADDVVIHLIAREESLADDTEVALDGEPPSLEELLNPEAGPRGPAVTTPAYLMGATLGGAILPAPLLAAKIATSGARIEPIVHPGAAPPEPRRTPSRKLARFVRCRDLTCRFPGCDAPAEFCDLDHTIPYPHGATCASNIKCLCRKHHLLKTFLGWRDTQHPDGTVEWISPAGQKYTTHPGSRLLFPQLCRPTAPTVVNGEALVDEPARTLKMPRRKQTRAYHRAKAIDDERQLNETYLAERNKPPPF